MRKRYWACALVLMGCDEEDPATPAVIDRSLMDASGPRTSFDAAPNEGDPVDAATLEPPCPAIEVCIEGEPGLLYNVCITGTASGAVAEPACLVDPNGLLYLAPLTAGQLVTSQGWTQSTNATLSAADQARCQSARADLLVDASTLPACAGGMASDP